MSHLSHHAHVCACAQQPPPHLALSPAPPPCAGGSCENTRGAGAGGSAGRDGVVMRQQQQQQTRQQQLQPCGGALRRPPCWQRPHLPWSSGSGNSATAAAATFIGIFLRLDGTAAQAGTLCELPVPPRCHPNRRLSLCSSPVYSSLSASLSPPPSVPYCLCPILLYLPSPLRLGCNRTACACC